MNLTWGKPGITRDNQRIIVKTVVRQDLFLWTDKANPKTMKREKVNKNILENANLRLYFKIDMVTMSHCMNDVTN